MVQYFAENLDGFAVTAERLGAVLRQPLHAPVDPVGRRRPRPQPITVEWADLRAVADRQAGEGHADRPGHDPGLVLRPRRPAAGRDRQPGGPGPARRDRRPRGRRHRGHPGRRARAARAAAAARRRPGRLPGLVGRRVPARHRRASRTRPRSTPTCATRSSASSSTPSTAWTPTSPRSRPPARTWRSSTTSSARLRRGVGPGVYDIHSPRVPERRRGHRTAARTR